MEKGKCVLTFYGLKGEVVFASSDPKGPGQKCKIMTSDI